MKRRTFAASPKPHHGASLKDFHSPSRTVTPVQAPSPKPHYGASIKDYSPARTETPPYPNIPNEIDQHDQKQTLPSPPLIDSPSDRPCSPQTELPLPLPPEPEPEGGWKEEVSNTDTIFNFMWTGKLRTVAFDLGLCCFFYLTFSATYR